MKKILSPLSEIIFVIFILLVFFYSAYQILSHFEIIKIASWGAFCQEDNCECNLCQCECPPCPWPTCPLPSPTPTPSPVPTPTPTFEPTPTPTRKPTPTLTPTPTLEPIPTATPTSPPAIGGPPGPAVAPICGAAVPSAPKLIRATRTRSDQVELVWTAVSLATHYSLSYGLSSGDYLYGVDNTGKVTAFTVGNLDPGASYCFALRAVNDCAPSELSNEICTGVVLGAAVGGQVLGAATLADTGSLTDELLQILFIIGSICLSLGLKLFLPCRQADFPAKKLA